jgi:hypothetical protein
MLEIEVSCYKAGDGWGCLCHEGLQALTLIYRSTGGIVDVDQEYSLLGGVDLDCEDVSGGWSKGD